MKIVYLTAGAAGMYCGSCMLDNALARAMIKKGHDALLVPVYTPIRTDEEDVSLDRVFLGGVNVFLQQKLPWLKYLPRWLDSALNRPWLIRRLTANAGSTSPKLLGALAVSMLKGMEGNQRKEVARLCDWLENEIRPDALLLTNLLIGGCVPEFKRRIKVPVYVTLQGDDIFLDSLPEPFRQQSVDAMRRLVPAIDGFIVHSHNYGHRMAKLFQIPDEKWHVVPLGIDTTDFESDVQQQSQQQRITSSPSPQSSGERGAGGEGLSLSEVQHSVSQSLSAENEVEAGSGVRLSERGDYGPVTIGYFARMATEKGLHLLIDAFIELAGRPENADLQLLLAGWMGPQHAEYWDLQQKKLNRANLIGRWSYLGSIDRREKIDFFRRIDLLSVPTTYQEPKGIFVLEAAAAGVPYVQPDHGAFPELHQRLAAGWLFPTGDTKAYVDQLQIAITHVRSLKQLAISSDSSNTSQERIHREVSINQMATRVLDIVVKKTSV